MEQIKYLLLVSIFLTGCVKPEECKPTVVEVPVWTAPQFARPIRPIMRSSIDAKTDGHVVRDSELNTLDLMKYAEDLEAIVDKIK